MTPKIVYEDKNLLAVNKPAGLLIHPALPKNKIGLTPEPTLIDWLKKERPEIKNVGDDPENRPGLVHRLDKETSGVLIIAKNQKTFEYLKGLFQSGKIKKAYVGLVWGKIIPQNGTIDKPIGLNPGTTKRTVAIQNAKMIKPSITNYQVKKYFKNFSLLEIQPLTGRTHQIRVHLNAIRHPIVGDKLYGKKPLPDGLNRQFLHAASIEFTDPDGSRIKIETSLPDDLDGFLKSIEPADPDSDN